MWEARVETNWEGHIQIFLYERFVVFLVAKEKGYPHRTHLSLHKVHFGQYCVLLKSKMQSTHEAMPLLQGRQVVHPY